MSDAPVDPPARRPSLGPRRFAARLRAVRQLRRQPMPDVSGLTPAQVLLWAARNKKYEEIIKLAHEADRPTIATAEEREPDPPAQGDTPAAEPPEQPAEPRAAEPSSGEQATSPATTEPPAPPPEQATSARPGEPPQSPEWWQERARWRLRTAADYADWEDNDGPQAEHDYDPFEDV